MNSKRRLTALEKRIGPIVNPGPFHVLVVESGQEKKQMVADFKKAHDIQSDDQLWIVEAVEPDRFKGDTDELQQTD